MAERKIAPKDVVVNILKDVLYHKLKVESQEELCKIVLKELKKLDKNYTLTPLRLRKIALSLPEIEVKAKTRKSVGMKKIEKCPICESSINPFKVKNLMNKEIVIGYECTRCGYQSDLEAFMPMKYIFILKQRYK
jgi:transposase-like protein